MYFVMLRWVTIGGRSYSRTVGYSRGLLPSKRLGSHEREITNIGTGE